MAAVGQLRHADGLSWLKIGAALKLDEGAATPKAGRQPGVNPVPAGDPPVAATDAPAPTMITA
jgi:hypothetical protein